MRQLLEVLEILTTLEFIFLFFLLLLNCCISSEIMPGKTTKRYRLVTPNKVEQNIFMLIEIMLCS